MKNLHVVAEDREILHGVNLEINPKETVVITGANGAGKSSLARAIAGLIPHVGTINQAETLTFISDGTIKFNGQNLTTAAISEHVKAGIFLAHQAPVEIPGITLTELLHTALEEQTGKPIKRAVVQQKITDAATKLNLDLFMAGREVNVGFSGGERKKAEILQLLVLSPKLAILDEPDSGLDADNAKLISKILKNYQEETGISYLIITHNQWILKNLQPDKKYQMQDGRLV